MTELAALWPDEAIEAMHLAALSLLERAGVRVESPSARELFLAAGCSLGAQERVSIPRAVVDDALAACPREYVLAARDPEKSLAMDPDPAQTYVHNLGGARDVVDPRSGAGRRATLRDQVLATRVMHHLAHQQQVTSLWQPEDVPDLLEPLYSYLVLAHETDKDVGGPGISHAFQAQYLQQMAVAVTGADGGDGTYPVDLAFSPVSPLVLGARRRRRARGAGAPRRRGGGDPAVPGRRHDRAGRALGGAGAAARRSAGRRRAHAAGRPGHAGVLRPAPQRRRPAQRRRASAARRRPASPRWRPSCWRGAAASPATATARAATARSSTRSSASSAPSTPCWGSRRTRACSPASARSRRASASCLEVLVIDDEVLNNAFYAVAPRPWDRDILDVEAMVDGVLSGRGFLGTKHTRRYIRSEFVSPSLSYRGGIGDWLAAGRSGIVDLAADRVEEYTDREPVGLPGDVRTSSPGSSTLRRRARHQRVARPAPRARAVDCGHGDPVRPRPGHGDLPRARPRRRRGRAGAGAGLRRVLPRRFPGAHQGAPDLRGGRAAGAGLRRRRAPLAAAVRRGARGSRGGLRACRSPACWCSTAARSSPPTSPPLRRRRTVRTSGDHCTAVAVVSGGRHVVGHNMDWYVIDAVQQRAVRPHRPRTARASWGWPARRTCSCSA